MALDERIWGSERVLEIEISTQLTYGQFLRLRSWMRPPHTGLSVGMVLVFMNCVLFYPFLLLIKSDIVSQFSHSVVSDSL